MRLNPHQRYLQSITVTVRSSIQAGETGETREKSYGLPFLPFLLRMTSNQCDSERRDFPGALMRLIRTVPIMAALLVSLAQAQSGTLRGIEVADIDRSADACTDFYQFANGRWRAENAIPASMPRGSRRWAAGEAAKDRLHDILTEVSAVPAPAKGSVEQQIGDFYAACTDETRINELGVKPIAPLLEEIGQVRDVAGVQRMIGRFHTMGIRVPFAVFAGSDNHKPTDVIAQIV